MEPIPAMDIINAQCVRLRMGDYNTKKVYSSDPLAMAKQFEQAGLKRLHLVDLDGAKQKRFVNTEVLRLLTKNTNLIIDVGGGLQSIEDFELVFGCGAAMATVGSLAASSVELTLKLLDIWGPQRLILGADCRDGKIAVAGWTDTTNLDILQFLKDYTAKGFVQVISTDIGRDGMLNGPAIELYKQILQTIPTIELIASGGIRSLDDLNELSHLGLKGAIIGKALYEGAIELESLGVWSQTQGGRI
ncbi:MAG: HisA/HisF-related TIM barrel protein [Sphaerochaetaceae bacterium]